MSKPTVFSCALLLASLAAGSVSAQDHILYAPAGPFEPITNAQPIPAPGPPAEPGTTVSPVTMTSHRELSPWITYEQPGCCEPRGANGEILMELYTRNGPSIPSVHGLGDRIVTGWTTEWGGRSLFYNPPETGAWVIDLSLMYTFNNGRKGQSTFLFTGTPETVTHLHRTDATLEFGREHYLKGSARSEGWKWRVGWDGGIRYGTTRMDVTDPHGNFNRLNSWNYGPELAVHTDWEHQCGCCIWIVGFRGEWAEVFNNKLESQSAIPHSVMDLSLLFTLGVRF